MPNEWRMSCAFIIKGNKKDRHIEWPLSEFPKPNTSR